MAQERPIIVIAEQALPHAPEEKNAVCRQLAAAVMLHPEMSARLESFCIALTNDVRIMNLDITFTEGKTSYVCFYIKTGESLVCETVPFLGVKAIPEFPVDATPYLDLVLRLRNNPMDIPISHLVRVVSESIARLYGRLSARSRVRTIHVHFKYDIHANPRECVMRVLI